MKVSKEERLLWKKQALLRASLVGLSLTKSGDKCIIQRVASLAAIQGEAWRIFNAPASVFCPNGIDRRRARRHRRKQKALCSGSILIGPPASRLTTPTKEQVNDVIKAVREALKDNDSQVIIIGEDAE